MKKLHNKNEHLNHSVLYGGILLAVLSMLAGIFLPKYLLERRAEAELFVVTNASETYYLSAETAMAKNESKQLSALDRIKLISGTWESSSIKKQPGSDNLTEPEAVTLAKQQISIFSQYNIYPDAFSSSFDNWYSWSTEFYEYTDSVFQTYTTYLWVIHFTRFDGSLEHTILMTENGTILSAEVNMIPKTYYPLRIAYANDEPETLLGDDKIKVSSLSYTLDTSNIDMASLNIDAYPYIDLSNASIENLYEVGFSTNHGEPEYFYLYQYTTNTSYGFGIVPVQ